MSASKGTIPRLVFLALIVATLLRVEAFTPTSPSPLKSTSRSCLLDRLFARNNNINSDEPCLSRTDFISLFTLATSLVVHSPSVSAAAEEQDETPSTKSIDACKVVSGAPTNCISTSSVKQVDCYAPPWTFEVSEEEAMARLKGVIASDPTLVIEQVSSSPRYLRVTTLRGPIGVTDEMKFLINSSDKVVTFRSAEMGEPTVNDFGANRKRLESIRKKANVFGVMGEGLTADSYGNRGTGPLQQLKAFYGLQSGGGYEAIFEDD